MTAHPKADRAMRAGRLVTCRDCGVPAIALSARATWIITRSRTGRGASVNARIISRGEATWR